MGRLSLVSDPEQGLAGRGHYVKGPEVYLLFQNSEGCMPLGWPSWDLGGVAWQMAPRSGHSALLRAHATVSRETGLVPLHVAWG